MNCTNCGAPLPAKSNICGFCKTLNDTDLFRFSGNVTKGEEAETNCPRCDLKLRSVALNLGQDFNIERCRNCLGLFFDPSELASLLDSVGSSAHEIDHARMQTLIDEEVRHQDPNEFSYVPCPACSQLMHRKAYGVRAGVIVDRCKEHGVWLDGGELGQLLKWVAAGGQKHDNEYQERARKIELAKAKAPSPLSSVVTADWKTPASEQEWLIVGVLRFVRYLLS
jgi:Zn-finger nucleic acid-binding protein